MRELSEEEIDWLEEFPEGESHEVEGSENLAACEDCGWTAQGESFDYLMSLVTDHLKETYKQLSEPEIQLRQMRFRSTFGWDPWDEGVLSTEDELHLFDFLIVSERGDEGEPISDVTYAREIEEPDDDND